MAVVDLQGSVSVLMLNCLEKWFLDQLKWPTKDQLSKLILSGKPFVKDVKKIGWISLSWGHWNNVNRGVHWGGGWTLEKGVNIGGGGEHLGRGWTLGRGEHWGGVNIGGGGHWGGGDTPSFSKSVRSVPKNACQVTSLAPKHPICKIR